MRLSFRVAPFGDSDAEPPASAWLAVPLTLIIAVPIADRFLPPGIHLAHFLAVALAFTAAIAGARFTTAVSGLAVPDSAPDGVTNTSAPSRPHQSPRDMH
jgi:hypothetical protein